MRAGIIAVAAMLATGCQTAQQQEQPIWGRFDCRRPSTDPEVMAMFEQAKAVCINRAQAAGIAGTAAMPQGYGMSGAIVAGINQGITSAQIQMATARSCMAEYGFLLAMRAEHEARCPVPVAQPSPPPRSTPVRRSAASGQPLSLAPSPR